MTTTLTPNTHSISEALHELRSPQGVICFKLNGRYVLSCDPYQDEAVQRINELKGRKAGRPLVMIFKDREAIDRAEVHSPLLHLLPTFAPLLTVSIPAPVGISRSAHQGIGMLGIGLVDRGVGEALLSEWGGPLLVSSANPTGQPSPRSAAQLRAYGFELPIIGQIEPDERADERPPQVTVVTLASSKVKVLSPGLITERELNEEWERLIASGLI